MLRKFHTLLSRQTDASLSDVETGEHRSITKIPLLSGSTINDETEDDEMIIADPTRTRSASAVSRVTLPEDAAGTLSFHHINYVVGGDYGSNSKRCRNPMLNCLNSNERKQILNDVSGKFTTGMNAILGPTGCGKSSLLDILADRKERRGISGTVLVDGLPRHPSYKYAVGYVVQDDIFSGILTVRENLFFSANLRLPKTVSMVEKIERVSSVIRDLSLESCADTRMGTELLRGVSGGEKKRTCIGMELVLSPKILFLDEPTTGLDASTASSVMECLKRLAAKDRTIIFSIHQPRYSIFKLFDTATFMCKGHCIYHGIAHDVVSYFDTLGYQCETHDNPTDFVLDILIEAMRAPQTLKRLTDAYQSSSMHANIMALADIESKSSRKDQSIRSQPPVQIAAAQPLTTETYYLSKRTLKNSLRNPAMALAQTVVSILMGFLVGIVFYDLKNTIEPGVRNREGTIFFIIVNQVFSTLSAIEPLLQERPLFLHEYAGGYYRIPSFFVAKLMCDLLPLRAIPSILFSVIAYFMTGLARTASQFFVFLITIFIASIFGASVSFFISTIVSTFAIALIIVVLIFATMMLFSGFLIELSSVFSWLSWMQWISAFRYATNALTINEFQGLKLCLANITNFCPMTGEDVLNARGIAHGTPWDLWKNVLAVFIMSVVFFILTSIQLYRTKKTR